MEHAVAPRELTRAFSPGDILHVARTPCAGLGLSVLRNGCLVLAVGAISAVPLGNNVQATTPHDLVQQAEFVFQQRDPAFELHEYPIQISIDGKAGISGKAVVIEDKLKVQGRAVDREDEDDATQR